MPKKFEASKSFADEYAYHVARIVEKDHQESVSPIEKARWIYGLNVTGQTLRDEAFAQFEKKIPLGASRLKPRFRVKWRSLPASKTETLNFAREYLVNFADKIESDRT